MENSVFDENYFDIIKSKLYDCDNINLKIKPQNKILLQSFETFNLKFKNKFCFDNFCDDLFCENGKINFDFFEFFNKIAKTSVSLICSGGLDVEAENNNLSEENIQIISNELLKFHSNGTKLFLKLKTNKGRLENNQNALFLTSSSFNREFYDSNKICFSVFDSQCKKIAKKFAKLSKFAQNATFDGIVIDASLNNLLGEMMSDEFNRRKLGYFSSVIDFPKKILDEIKKSGVNLPIIMKISPISFLFNCFYDKKILTLKNVKFKQISTRIFVFLKELTALGVDGFLFEFGAPENEFFNQFSPFIAQNLYTEFYQELNVYFDKNNTKNRFNEKPLLILSDNFDFSKNSAVNNCLFNITRELLADFDFIFNMFNAKPIKHCLRCGICKKTANEKRQIYCSINPQISCALREKNFQPNQKVAVVGAGLSGMIAATTLAKRGMTVDLYEKQNKINSSARACEIFGTDKYLKNFNDFIENELNSFVGKNIQLKLKTKFETENAKDYDKLIIAAGFKELFLGVPGAVLKSVVSIFDVLNKKYDIGDRKNIVIYAKSELALKLALFLASKKHKVVVLINNIEFLNNIPQNLFSYYLLACEAFKINIVAMCQVKNINEDSVEVFVNHKTRHLDFVSLLSNLRSKKEYKFQPEAKMFDCDLFIYDPEVVSNNKLYYEIVKSGYLGEIYLVGDALQISNLDEEIKSAYFVGNNL